MDAPVLMIYGDFIAQDARWPAIRANGVRFAKAVRVAGGTVEVVELPKRGIRGNSHMVTMDRTATRRRLRCRAGRPRRGSGAEDGTRLTLLGPDSL